jgi:hypothetical protein
MQEFAGYVSDSEAYHGIECMVKMDQTGAAVFMRR